MVLEDPITTPRDLKQVQNKKYLQNKKKRYQTNECTQQRQKNTADDIIALLNMIHVHPFIQEIVQTKGKPPGVILYLKEQLQEMKMFCSSDAMHPSALGVDRTFNLGPCYVTMLLVYHQKNLMCKGTKQPSHNVWASFPTLGWLVSNLSSILFSLAKSIGQNCMCSSMARNCGHACALSAST